jgi:hypothetical protein
MLAFLEQKQVRQRHVVIIKRFINSNNLSIQTSGLRSQEQGAGGQRGTWAARLLSAVALLERPQER